MNQAKKDFLSLANPPARLGIEETAWLLGFNEHDIAVLVSAGLLKPLGAENASLWHRRTTPHSTRRANG